MNPATENTWRLFLEIKNGIHAGICRAPSHGIIATSHQFREHTRPVPPRTKQTCKGRNRLFAAVNCRNTQLIPVRRDVCSLLLNAGSARLIPVVVQRNMQTPNVARTIGASVAVLWILKDRFSKATIASAHAKDAEGATDPRRLIFIP